MRLPFVDLTSVRDPRLIAAVTAESIGLNHGGTAEGVDGLTAHLRHREFVLALDNFEHSSQDPRS